MRLVCLARSGGCVSVFPLTVDWCYFCVIAFPPYHPSMQNKEIRLASRPAGRPTLDNFNIVDIAVPQPKEREVLVRTLYISVDPYLRGRMREGRSYVAPFEVGQVIESGAVGEVIESRSPEFQPGDIVTGMFG